MSSVRMKFGPLLLLFGAYVPEAAAQQNQTPGLVAIAGDDSRLSGRFEDLIGELQKTWPRNRSIRFVFHGHSVPAGYFRTPAIRRFDSYPLLFARMMGERFPTASIDISVTAIGGENSVTGAHRFESDVLSLRPDVIFIDYSLNDRRPGLEAARSAWSDMIQAAQGAKAKVVLLTPTPDQRVSLLQADNALTKHAEQVRQLGKAFDVPVVDSYRVFQDAVRNGTDLPSLMSQVNHPNRSGHELVAQEILKLFPVP